MTVNLEADQIPACDPTQWSKLQTEVCMKIARGKLDAFSEEAYRLADLVRYGLMTRSAAADCLFEAARYNQLITEYGMDHLQAIMSAAFCEVA